MNDDSVLSIYTARQAADFLSVSYATVKHHLYVSRTLKPDGRIGNALVFTLPTLQQFQANRRKPGRPRSRVDIKAPK